MELTLDYPLQGPADPGPEADPEPSGVGWALTACSMRVLTLQPAQAQRPRHHVRLPLGPSALCLGPNTLTVCPSEPWPWGAMAGADPKARGPHGLPHQDGHQICQAGS